jgi:hypothetical protein
MHGNGQMVLLGVRTQTCPRISLSPWLAVLYIPSTGTGRPGWYATTTATLTAAVPIGLRNCRLYPNTPIMGVVNEAKRRSDSIRVTHAGYCRFLVIDLVVGGGTTISIGALIHSHHWQTALLCS